MVPELNVSAKVGDRTRVKYEYHAHEGRKISYIYENIRIHELIISHNLFSLLQIQRFIKFRYMSQ